MNPPNPSENNTPRRPILIGQAEEIDLVQPQVKKILENPGFYIGTDPRHPNVLVPLWVDDGKVFSMKIDNELKPDRFLDGIAFSGPFLPEST